MIILQSVLANVVYNISEGVNLNGFIALKNPSTCKPGDAHTGGGTLDVNVPKKKLVFTGTAALRMLSIFPTLLHLTSFLGVACDGSGSYSFEMTVDTKGINFTVSDRTFYLGKSTLSIG